MDGVKPLLVGENNPLSALPRWALYPWPPNSAGARLCAHLGMTVEQYLGAFERTNLFDVAPARWRIADARQAAGLILTAFDSRTVIMLGARVAAAFNMEHVPLWGARAESRRVFVRFPHPSGRCRVWNDRRAVRRARGLASLYVLRDTGGIEA